MEFIDYDWDDIAGSFVKRNLGADFTFTTNSDLTLLIIYQKIKRENYTLMLKSNWIY